MNNARTTQIEKVIAELLGKPLMRENVFHSVKFARAGIEKEVCDVLLVHRREALVISIKGRDVARSAEKEKRWIKKAAAKAVAQLRGANRTLLTNQVWCDHISLGRRDFQCGDLTVCHSIALIEAAGEVLVDANVTGLNQANIGPPLTLMAIHDFINLVKYLRTFRDLRAYLDGRSAVLRDPDRRTLGTEKYLLNFYTANRDSFATCTGIGDARLVSAAGKHILEGSAFRDRELVQASILEEFIAGISGTAPDGFPPEMAALIGDTSATETAAHKQAIRDDLCDLTVQERAALGEHIGHLCGRIAEQKSERPLLYGATQFTRLPEKIFVVVVGWEADHREALADTLDLTMAACAYRQKPVGIWLLINQIRDSVRYSMGRVSDFKPNLEYVEAGREYFEHVQLRRVDVARRSFGPR